MTTYPDIGLTFDFKFAAQSGGHTHQATETFAKTAHALKDVQKIVTDITLDSNLSATGTTELEFPNFMRVTTIADEASGQVVTHMNEGAMANHLFPGTATEGTIPYDVRYAGLVAIPTSANPFVYDLGGNKNQPPFGSDGTNHDENHFADPALVDEIVALGTAFTTAMPCCVIIVDDASLEDGGMFDIKGNFDPLTQTVTQNGHVSHRIGIDFDIQTRLRDRGTGGLVGGIIPGSGDKARIMRVVEPYVQLQGGFIAPEPTIHVRFK